MAEEEIEEQEEAQAAQPVEQPSLLRYLPIVLMVLLLQSGLAYLLIEGYLFPSPDRGATTTQDAEGRPRKIPEGDEPEASVDLGEFIANARGTQARLLVRATVTLTLAPGGVKSEIESDRNRDRVRDAVIAALSDATPERLRSPEGRQTVKQGIKDRLNAFLYDGQVLEVYFGSFILQAMPGYKEEPVLIGPQGTLKSG